MKPIHLFGSDYQKARFLPDLAAGGKLAGFALTEPGPGSDMRAITTNAQRQADGSWVLNGDKRWIGNGGKDVVCVFARSDHGPVALIVEKGMPGFDAPERYDTLGLRGNDLRRLTFRDVRVPKENMLGEAGDGLRIAMHTLNNGRMSLGTGVVGATKRLIRLAVEHTTTRNQFNRPLAEFELVEDKIAWMTSYLYGFESMAYLTTGLVDAGVPDYSIESAMAKIAGSEFYWYAANRVFQLLGGQAYMADSPAAKALRDGRIFPIFEGSNDVLRSFVALAGLKTVADEVADLRNLNLADPIDGIGVLADYVGQRVQRRLRPDRLDAAHPTLSRHGNRVAEQVGQLRATAEKLLRIHGSDIQNKQRQQKRLYPRGHRHLRADRRHLPYHRPVRRPRRRSVRAGTLHRHLLLPTARPHASPNSTRKRRQRRRANPRRRPADLHPRRLYPTAALISRPRNPVGSGANGFPYRSHRTAPLKPRL